MTNTDVQWTKTTPQSGQMVITLHPGMVEGLDLDDLATYLTDQGWTRRPTQRPASTSDAAKRNKSRGHSADRVVVDESQQFDRNRG